MTVQMTRRDRSLITREALRRRIYQTAAVILLSYCYTGASQEFVRTVTVDALLGHDVVLPCHLEPPVDATTQTVEWARENLLPKIVHLRRNEMELLEEENPQYAGRTSLFTGKLKTGNLSLLLRNTELNDSGIYTCQALGLNPNQVSSVDLRISSVFVPVVRTLKVDMNMRKVILGCQTEGWSPEAKLSWLDDKGNVLATQMSFLAANGFHSINSNIIRDSGDVAKVTCRVSTRQGSQSRESSTFLPDVVLPSRVNDDVIISLLVIFVIVLAIGVAVFGTLWQKEKKRAALLTKAPPRNTAEDLETLKSRNP